MTPLAHQIIKLNESCDDLSKFVLKCLPVAQFFECTAVRELSIAILNYNADTQRPDEELLFLPAPITWIEEKLKNFRIAYMLFDDPNDKDFLAVLSVYGEKKGWQTSFLGWVNRKTAKIHLSGDIDGFKQAVQAKETESCELISQAVAYLAMINTPRVIGRRQHTAHEGLRKIISSRLRHNGKFPLNGWTEIILEVTPPKLDDGEPHESRLTGAKALHFCRQHLRIQNGKIVLVRSHWRGDANLGIKRSRYTVVPPKGQTA
jgi:hypothetical protein